MVRPVRLAILALAFPLAALPAVAAGPKVLNDISIFATVSLGCALDYSNPNETRFIISNTSGRIVAKGSRIGWTTRDQARSFTLPRAIDVDGVYSFGLNAKGSQCSATATPPPLVRSAD